LFSLQELICMQLNASKYLVLNNKGQLRFILWRQKQNMIDELLNNIKRLCLRISRNYLATIYGTIIAGLKCDSTLKIRFPMPSK